jgi:hypothetical protein
MPIGVYVRSEENLRNVKIANQKLTQDPEWRRKNKEANQKKAQDPEWRRKNKEAAIKRAQDPEWIRKQREKNENPEYIRKITEMAQKRAQDPEWIRKHNESSQKACKDPEWIRKNTEQREKMYQDPEWRRKHKEGIQKNIQNPEWIRKNKEALQKLTQDPEWRRKNKESTIRLAQDTEWLCKVVESKIGGFWYGNVRYYDGKKLYCPIWGPDLWNRIEVFWGGRSILSGVRINPNGRKLTKHHVYYNKKSCCIENDDGSYSVEINGQIYPIIGDPNKFVLLTDNEHGMLTGHLNKVWYMRYFEWLINTKFNGKSYYTQEEYEALKMEGF